MPKYVKWMIYTSYFFYGFEALCINEFEHKSYKDEVLKDLAFSGNKYEDIGCLCGFFIFYRILAYLFLKYRHREKR